MRPSQIRVYDCHKPKGIKLLTRLRVGLSHLCEHKFKHSFQDTFNLICNCGEDIETTCHYLLHCPDYLQERVNLMNTVSCIVPNIFDFNNDHLTEILKKILMILIIQAYWMPPLTTQLKLKALMHSFFDALRIS